MSDKKKSLPKAWQNTDKSIRAVQVVFELDQTASVRIRMAAIDNDMSPSDQIRDILGLTRKKPVRPRLSVSLSDEDYQILARRYGLSVTNKDAIRDKMKQELLQFKRSKR